ncbi:MAG: LacI family DNA-binding transcriptional regulator [Pseudomonadota bacterium]
MSENQRDRADITEVARLAGVSASTVSRAFNHPDLVKLTTRRRVERAVEELGYIRNRAAQAMHGKRSATIGLIVPTVNNAIFSELIQSFTDAVDREGFTILIAAHGFDLRREYAMTRKLLEHRVDGLALIGLDHIEATYTLIQRQSVPAITIWNHAPGSRLPAFGADNFDAGSTAAQYLIDRGHREIGLIFPPTPENDRARRRLEGALSICASEGISIPDQWRLEAPYDLERSKQAARDLLNGETRPRALICGNDVIAQGAVYGALEAGLTLPGNVAIVGIGDFPGSAEMVPGISTVRLPARRIGRMAGSKLCEAILTNRLGQIESHRFVVEMIARSSS